MAQKPTVTTKKIRSYLEQGVAPKDIAKKLKVSAQRVYNVQYQMRKRAGLVNQTGSSGIAAVKKPTNNVGTGITSLPTVTITPATKPLELTIPIVKPKPTLWQRIKRVFGWQ
jgi:hypothetical protein